MCNRRARAGRARQLGFPRRGFLLGLCAVLVTAAGAASLTGCSTAAPQSPRMSALAARAAEQSEQPAQSEQPSSADPRELSAALLSGTDMGSNFSLLPEPTGSAATAGAGKAATTATGTGTTSVTGCPQLGILRNVGTTLGQDEQGVTYQSVDGLPVVGESLRTDAGARLAADYAADRAALTACTGLTIATDGTVFDLKLTHVALGGVKSATAVRLDGTLEGVQVNGYLALDDVGPAELAYLFLQVGTGAPQPAVYYFERADAKARNYLDTVWSS